MAKLPSAFKRKDHGTMNDRSSIPKGDYIGKIIKSDYKQNKNKDGHYLRLDFELQNKEVKGRKVVAILNLDNPSDSAVEMANNELATILDAVGYTKTLKDSKEIHNKPMVLSLVETDSGNDIVMYNSLSAAGAGEDDEDLDDDDDLDEDEDLDEDADDADDDDDDDDDDEIKAEDVQELARKYKKANNLKKLKKMLSDYDIEKISEIEKLSEDDLESLKEDFEDEL